MSNGVAATYPERIRDAYYMFKGGCENIPQSRDMLDVVETARTTGVAHPEDRRKTIRNAVHVYLKEGHTEIPDVVETVIDKFDLTEADRTHHYGTDEIEKLSLVREGDL